VLGADSAQAITAATTTTVTSSKNPSSCEQSVTFTIIVTVANTLTRVTEGTITFTLAPDPPLTSLIRSSGQSEFKIHSNDPALNCVGPHALTAPYNGTSTSNPSSASLTQFSTSAHDFDGNCKGDILWYNTASGQVVNWLVNGASLIGGGSPGSAAN